MGKIAVHTGGGGGGGELPYVVGTYNASGRPDDPRFKYIDLGFMPTAVYVESLLGERFYDSNYGCSGGLALRGKDFFPTGNRYSTCVHIESGGFEVAGRCNMGGEFYYIAFR